MDYLRYWSLLRKPFSGGNDPVFFAGIPQREAIAGLNYFVANRLQTALLTSSPGCGMTSLLRYAKQMRGFGDDAAELILTVGNQTSRAGVQATLCRALGYSDNRYADAQDDLAARINRTVEASVRERVQLVWLIDRCGREAASLAGELVSQHPGFSAVVGISSQSHRELTVNVGQCGMQIDLSPLSIEDTVDYLQHGVTKAGGARSLFPDNSAIRLHELTGGVLAELSVAAESSLALAASHQMKKVTTAIVEAIDERLAAAA